jgi:hypothetical protein
MILWIFSSPRQTTASVIDTTFVGQFSPHCRRNHSKRDGHDNPLAD